MFNSEKKYREARGAGFWYPLAKADHKFEDNPKSSAVISPHAGFRYSGALSLEAISGVKKNRVWVFGTCHREAIENSISIHYGDYTTSIGKAKFPELSNLKHHKIVEKYFSDRGHRTEEHSIENVLFSLNHFQPDIPAFCVYVQGEDEDGFDRVSDDIANLWQKDDSIVVSTDWNHYVSTNSINGLMKEASGLLAAGEIKELFNRCMKGKQEACGIDGVYLAHKVLSKVGEKSKFKILAVTDSSKSEKWNPGSIFSSTCVGYIAAKN
jgi:AmmeMemoRadiSam system protein B